MYEWMDTLSTVCTVLPKESGWNVRPVLKVAAHSHVKHVRKDAVTWERRTQPPQSQACAGTESWPILDALKKLKCFLFVNLFTFIIIMSSYGKGKMTTKWTTRGKMIRRNGNAVGGEKRSPRRSRNTGQRKGEDGLERKKATNPSVMNLCSKP